MANETDLVVKLRADSQKLQRDLDRAKQRISGFQRQSAAMSKAIQANFAAMFGGAALASAGRFAVQTLADFEFQMSKVAAVSRATVPEMEALTKNARDLGARSKFTATEIGKLQEEFSRLGFAANDIIKLTDATRQLATVADADLGESAKVVGNVINAFGLETAEAGRIANTMAESFSRSALDLEKFSVAMGNVGANAKAFGLTVEETTAYLGALVDAGIDASKAGTDLRTILIESNKAGITLNEAFDMVRNSTDKLGTATELFGKRAGAAGIILADNTEKVHELNAAFSDSTLEMQKMTKVMEDNLTTAFREFQSALEGVILEGGALNGVMTNLVDTGTSFLRLFQDFDFGRFMIAAFSGFNAEVIKGIDSIKQMRDELNKLPATVQAPFKITAESLGIKTPPKNTTAGAKKRTNIATGTTGESRGFANLLDESFGSVPDIMGEINEIIKDTLTETRNTFKAGFFEIQQVITKSGQNIQAVFLDLGDLINGGLTALISGFDVGGLKGALASFMGFIGDAMVQLGQALIAINTGKLALSKVPPPAGIAIGASLIAAGAVLSNSANKKLGGLSTSAGFSGGGFSGNVGGRQTINLDGQFVVRGSDLVYVLNRENNITGRTG